MRCLKRYVAREIYRQILNPVPAPDITDLRQKRKSLGLNINAVAGELSQWPSVISRLERGILRNDDLATSYRKWLEEQSDSKNELTTIGASLGIPENIRNPAQSGRYRPNPKRKVCALHTPPF